jgi:hypothetical protein
MVDENFYGRSFPLNCILYESLLYILDIINIYFLHVFLVLSKTYCFFFSFSNYSFIMNVQVRRLNEKIDKKI